MLISVGHLKSSDLWWTVCYRRQIPLRQMSMLVCLPAPTQPSSEILNVEQCIPLWTRWSHGCTSAPALILKTSIATLICVCLLCIHVRCENSSNDLSRLIAHCATVTSACFSDRMFIRQFRPPDNGPVVLHFTAELFLPSKHLVKQLGPRFRIIDWNISPTLP